MKKTHKVLQVITSLHIGGAEKLIIDMVPLYKKYGYGVDVLLFDGTETFLKKQLQDEGIKIFEFSRKSFVYNPFYIFKLIPFLKRYDILHTHNTACQYFVALAKFISFSKTKIVTTEHNTNNRRRGSFIFRILDKFIYKQYNTIISISELTSKLLAEHINSNKNIITIENGIDLSKFKNAKNLDKTDFGFNEADIIITMVAGFRKQKDQDTLIKSLKLLPENFKLCLVGGGERENICQNLVSELELNDRVKFLGLRNDIPEILKTSDIVVMSSHWEGLSLSSVEGLISGRPFIASDVNGLKEVVQDAGILFTPGDFKELANIILELTSNKEYYLKVSEKCKKRAEDFSILNTVKQYVEVYNSLLK